MPKALAFGGLAVVLIVAASMSLATASPNTPSRDGRAVKIIRLVATPTEVTQLDLGEQGQTQGDQIIFADDLFRDGRKVGEDGVVCSLIRVEPPSAVYQCAGTLSLPDGQITIQGLTALPPSSEPFDVAITGGTGAEG
jgi:hypothetical protein